MCLTALFEMQICMSFQKGHSKDDLGPIKDHNMHFNCIYVTSDSTSAPQLASLARCLVAHRRLLAQHDGQGLPIPGAWATHHFLTKCGAQGHDVDYPSSIHIYTLVACHSFYTTTDVHQTLVRDICKTLSTEHLQPNDSAALHWLTQHFWASGSGEALHRHGVHVGLWLAGACWQPLSQWSRLMLPNQLTL